METVRFMLVIAVVLLGFMVLSDVTREAPVEPGHIEDWKMFADTSGVVYFFNARNGTLLRVHLDGTHPDFPFGYVAHVPFAIQDEAGRLVRGDFTDRLFGADRYYRRERPPPDSQD